MSCIHDDIIQKFIDGEANPEEVTLVEKHIANCNKCGVKIENQQRLATLIKKAITLIPKELIEIPKFSIPPRHIKTHSLTSKRLSYIIAAACILLFVFVIPHKKDLKTENEIMIEIGSVMDVDANRPVSQLPLVINIIDSKGNITEYYIK